MQLPKALLENLEGIKGFNKTAFEAVHASGAQLTSIRLNPAKNFPLLHFPFEIEPVPWSQSGYYLEKRPSFTFDPLFHAGCYYVQEASSMFLEQALKQTTDLTQPLKVLDLSAAPGGKSTHLQSLLSADSLLVSNEVIKARAQTLKQNIIKWGAANVVVTNSDAQHFQKLGGFFDVVVVDAPCSGSGLFRKDAEAIKEWSLDAVALCSGRQQRILADVVPALKEGGVLIYSTCSYSLEENEEVLDWLVQEMGLESISLQIDPSWGIVETQSDKAGAEGYRFYPDKVKGEGFFLACLRKTDGSLSKTKPSKPEMLPAKEKAFLAPWISGLDDLAFLKHGTTIYAVPHTLKEMIGVLQSALYIQYAGTTIGELVREKLIPDHALALSPLGGDGVEKYEADYETAIRYLQRKDIFLEPAKKGWQLISFKNHPLGWINVLPNRVNNYYPREMRILREFYD